MSPRCQPLHLHAENLLRPRASLGNLLENHVAPLLPITQRCRALGGQEFELIAGRVQTTSTLVSASVPLLATRISKAVSAPTSIGSSSVADFDLQRRQALDERAHFRFGLQSACGFGVGRYAVLADLGAGSDSTDELLALAGRQFADRPGDQPHRLVIPGLPGPGAGGSQPGSPR